MSLELAVMDSLLLQYAITSILVVHDVILLQFSFQNVIPKGGFFSESAIRFSNLQKKYSKSLS